MGGVDWNLNITKGVARGQGSPPTWVVWIEITSGKKSFRIGFVTTHMGGVDWNNTTNVSNHFFQLSPPTWVVWIEIMQTN